MTTPDDIKAWITENMAVQFVEVDGDGHHFEAVIVSELFEGLNTLARHRLVYSALGDKMRAEIHALSMKTYTPSQYNH